LWDPINTYRFQLLLFTCQGDMFRPNRSSSGPSRTQIQALFSFSALWDPINAYRFQLQA